MKHLILIENPKHDGSQRCLASMVYKFFDKKLLVVLFKMQICQTKNQLKNDRNQLLENLKNEKYIHLS